MTGLLRVFTIPASTPFIPVFVDAFLSGALCGSATPLSPETIADAVIFVPTRRAAQALGAALTAASPAGALLLPKILPLGDQTAIGEAILADFAEDGSLLPAVDDLTRQLLLFPMIEQWRLAIQSDRDLSEPEREPFFVAKSKADAFALTAGLGRLIDETIIEDVPLSRLAQGMPEQYDPARHDIYWDLTSRFLEIAAAQWPGMLNEIGMLDGADRAKRLIRAFARQLLEAPPIHPVIVAGSTGSVAATADLMAAVSQLPMGAVVLPGLDLGLDTVSFNLIGSEKAELPTRYAHPQGMLKRSIERIGITREAVTSLPLAKCPDTRAQLISELFRPAETTELWRTRALPPDAMDEALASLALMEASDEHEEALAIAIVMRETLEDPAKTVALVTPDRALARAVQAELGRWGLSVSDSAGEPLSSFPIAALARLALEACEPEATANTVLALLRNPEARIGHTGPVTALVDTIEIAGMRGRRLKSGAKGLAAVLRNQIGKAPGHRDPAPRKRLDAAAIEAASVHAELLATALDLLAKAFGETPENSAPTLRAAADAHRRAVNALVAGPDAEPGFLSGDAGKALDAIFDQLIHGREPGPTVDLQDYLQIFGDLASTAVVHETRPAHPRLKIWGLLEARLLDADRVILGGLSEGVWPPDARGDPFLNRPMRIALGLQPPERRIGQTAHDFAMLLGGREVILTRATKRQGSPAVASRFLRRLTAFIGKTRTETLVACGKPYLDWARALDRPVTVVPVDCPSPTIPPGLMPERLSLTEVETLYRDPYAIFARRVLRLDALEPADPPLEARERGTVIHDALAAYTRTFAEQIPADACARLMEFGREAFAPVFDEDAESAIFWWRRFEAFVPWFVDWDRERRKNLSALHVEVDGKLVITLAGDRTLTLSARADRIEQKIDNGLDSGLAILDYKTGSPPSVKQVLSGNAPQLTLTAAIALRGAFAGIKSDGEPELAYLKVSGARGIGKESKIKLPKPSAGDAFPEETKTAETLAEIAERQFAALERVLNEFALGMRGFKSHRMPEKSRFVGDYDHLARYLEWSRGGEVDSDTGEGEE